jgi:hypothetical protein
MRQSLKWLRAYDQIYMHLLPLHKSTNEYRIILLIVILIMWAVIPDTRDSYRWK